MMNSTTDIMERGINCLLEELGTIETERFIATIIRERFDYTNLSILPFCVNGMLSSCIRTPGTM